MGHFDQERAMSGGKSIPWTPEEHHYCMCGVEVFLDKEPKARGLNGKAHCPECWSKAMAAIDENLGRKTYSPQRERPKPEPAIMPMPTLTHGILRRAFLKRAPVVAKSDDTVVIEG